MKNIEDFSKEELINKILELEKENKKLKQKKKRNRKLIKTTKKQIVDYWANIEDECLMSVDWSEAQVRCWRCGCKGRLQRCHIIPASLGGKDEPSNLVLLCERCHIDAPNIESRTFMWDWIKANKVPFYDTFWTKRAEKEYEFIYDKSFFEELKERDIISAQDYERFFSIPDVRNIKHFAHPWINDSTYAGILRTKLEEYDKKYVAKKKKSKKFRQKEKKFDVLIWRLCKIAREYNFNVWEGRTKNSFSLVLSCFIDLECRLKLSVKLCRDNIYRACFTNEDNPNNIKVSEYDIELGEDEDDVEEFFKKEIKKFCNQYGKASKQKYVFTINPMYWLRKDME